MTFCLLNLSWQFGPCATLCSIEACDVQIKEVRCIQQHWMADSHGVEKYFRKLFWIPIGLESLHIMENGPRIKWWENAQVCVNFPLRPLPLVQTYFLQKWKRWILKIIKGHPVIGSRQVDVSIWECGMGISYEYSPQIETQGYLPWQRSPRSLKQGFS